MTLEQKIRNAGEIGVIGIEYNYEGEEIHVIDDFEGVLKCTINTNGGVVTRYLNGDKFYLTHEEAFVAEL